MDDESRDELRRVSKAAFGHERRLEVMLVIAAAEDGIFTLTALARSLDVPMSSLQRPVQSLIDTGLVTALPNIDSKYRYFTRNTSAAWAWAEELASQVQLAPNTLSRASDDFPHGT